MQKAFAIHIAKFYSKNVGSFEYLAEGSVRKTVQSSQRKGSNVNKQCTVEKGHWFIQRI